MSEDEIHVFKRCVEIVSVRLTYLYLEGMQGTAQHLKRTGVRRRERRRHAVSSDENEISCGEVRRQRGRQDGVLVEYRARWMEGVSLHLVQELFEWRLAGGEKFAGQDWLAAHDCLGRRRPPFQRHRRPDAKKDPGKV